MVEKKVKEFGLMRWLDQGVRLKKYMCVCVKFECCGEENESGYVVENVLKRYGGSLVGNEGNIGYNKYKESKRKADISKSKKRSSRVARWPCDDACPALIMETIHVDFDELTAMASKKFSLGPELQLMNPGTISSGLAQNPSPSTPYVPPTNKYWDILFQPMFDEYFQPPSVVSRAPPAAVAPISVDTTGTPSSTSVDQDAPIASTSLNPEDSQEPVLHQDIEGQEPPNA
ncbi:hypothetical protein Tco_0779204 [Tanacetum coccineum]